MKKNLMIWGFGYLTGAFATLMIYDSYYKRESDETIIINSDEGETSQDAPVAQPEALGEEKTEDKVYSYDNPNDEYYEAGFENIGNGKLYNLGGGIFIIDDLLADDLEDEMYDIVTMVYYTQDGVLYDVDHQEVVDEDLRGSMLNRVDLNWARKYAKVLEGNRNETVIIQNTSMQYVIYIYYADETEFVEETK